MFANQARSGPGPNLPPGRLAAQQMNMQQEPMYSQGPPNGGVASINKMTIPQAITLVTLRLGALESKMMSLEAHLPNLLGGDNQVGMDFSENGVIQSLMERVDNIEKSLENGDTNQTTNTIGSTNPTELAAIKNQLETIKQSIIQFKGISATLANDNKGLKAQIEKLRQELGEYKQLLNTLQTASLEHSQKILELELSVVPNTGMPLDEFEEDDIEGREGECEGYDNGEIQATFSLTNTNSDTNLSQQELLGVNLKEAIEFELNGI
jgi:chromosome segregation ATPase